LKLDGLDDFIRKVHHPKEDLVYVEVADETTSGSNITLGGRLKKVEEAVARIETAIAAALAH
jgi:hemerythrin-like domain-containing protein